MVAVPVDNDADSREVISVYDALRERNEDFDNDKMGMSEVGKECDRSIWYSWRWCSPGEDFTGPKLRIFKTGHVHEDLILDDLERGGMIVSRFDPDAKKDRHGRPGQWEVRGLNGHLKGKLDARIWNVTAAPKTEHVGEIKTHNDKSWKKVVKEKVEKAKPEHYGQMQLYMHFRGLTRALYVAENKNTSELYTERVEYNAPYCIKLLVRLQSIIDSARPPEKLHQDPTAKSAFACRWCKARMQCHENAIARTNCRTCLHSTPIDDGKWHCARWDREITYLEQREGCGAHLFIPELVPGEQIDCDTEAETVTYVMHEDGSTFVDGGDRPAEIAAPVVPEKSKAQSVEKLEAFRFWHHPESSSLWSSLFSDPDPREGGSDAGLVEEVDFETYRRLKDEYAADLAREQEAVRVSIAGVPCDACGSSGRVLRTLIPANANTFDDLKAGMINVQFETNVCEACGGSGRQEAA